MFTDQVTDNQPGLAPPVKHQMGRTNDNFGKLAEGMTTRM